MGKKGNILGLVADDTVFYGALILLVAVISFGLGRLSVVSNDLLAGGGVMQGRVTLATGTVPLTAPGAAETTVTAAPTSPATNTAQNTATGPYVASKNGTKYYLTSCSAANRIKAENRVYFASVGEATARGLSPAANCPGL